MIPVFPDRYPIQKAIAAGRPRAGAGVSVASAG